MWGSRLFWLECNCFTICVTFLLYDTAARSTHTSLLREPPSAAPHPTPRALGSAELPALLGGFLLAVCSMHGAVYTSELLSKSSHTLTWKYVQNLEKRCSCTYLQGRNGDADAEKGLWTPRGEGGRTAVRWVRDLSAAPRRAWAWPGSPPGQSRSCGPLGTPAVWKAHLQFARHCVL